MAISILHYNFTYSKYKIMRKLISLLTIVCLLQPLLTRGQITLEHSIDTISFGTLLYPTNISENETKYVLIDTTLNSFSLYNMDFTPYLTNISVPVQIWPWYRIVYVTKSLFDCDSSNIEYALDAPNGAYNPFMVLRTDGTVLLNVDSAKGPYCFGCLGGTQDTRPISNTSEGAKLFLIIDKPPGVTQTKIYSLCGSLPTSTFDFTSIDNSVVKLYPNPTTEMLTFEFNLPSNMENYQLIIYDGNSKVLQSENISANERLLINVKNYNSGTYYYNLISKSKKVQAGKFILTK